MDVESYGVTEKTISSSKFSDNKEELERNGYTLIEGGFNKNDLIKIKNKVSKCKDLYHKIHKTSFLKSSDEDNTIRAPFLLDSIFLNICFNKKLLEFITEIMGDNFILNQQNVIINPSKKKYNQSYWHRDLPYQHFTSSRPLAVNAIFCLDDFTTASGCTKVLPGSHLFETFPSDNYVLSSQKHIESAKGNFLVLNSMLYHSGSSNISRSDRLGINNVFSIPLIKRQIEIKEEDFSYKLTKFKKSNVDRIIKYSSPQSVSSFLKER